MDPERKILLDRALSNYKDLLNKIEKVYNESKNYFENFDFELEEILVEAEAYIYQVVNCIINANDVISDEERAFVENFRVYKPSKEVANYNTLLEATFDDVPVYIKMANKLDDATETNYSKELIKDTLALCKIIMDIDGNTYANESSFTYSFIDMLERYIKEN